MVMQYSRSCTLKEALVKTFDGQHPCSLCHAVQAGKKSEQKDRVTPLTKIDLEWPATPSGAVRHPTLYKYSISVTPLVTRAESPPTPPPKVAA